MEVNRMWLVGKIRYSVRRRNRYSWNPTRSVFNKGESRSARSVIEYCGATVRRGTRTCGGAPAGIADQHVNWCAVPRNNTRPPCLFKTDPHSSRRIKGVSGVLHRPRNTLLAGQRPRLCLKFRPRDPMTERNSIKFMYTGIRTGVESPILSKTVRYVRLRFRYLHIHRVQISASLFDKFLRPVALLYCGF